MSSASSFWPRARARSARPISASLASGSGSPFISSRIDFWASTPCAFATSIDLRQDSGRHHESLPHSVRMRFSMARASSGFPRSARKFPHSRKSGALLYSGRCFLVSISLSASSNRVWALSGFASARAFLALWSWGGWSPNEMSATSLAFRVWGAPFASVNETWRYVAFWIRHLISVLSGLRIVSGCWANAVAAPATNAAAVAVRIRVFIRDFPRSLFQGLQFRRDDSLPVRVQEPGLRFLALGLRPRPRACLLTDLRRRRRGLEVDLDDLRVHLGLQVRGAVGFREPPPFLDRHAEILAVEVVPLDPVLRVVVFLLPLARGIRPAPALEVGADSEHLVDRGRAVVLPDELPRFAPEGVRLRHRRLGLLRGLDADLEGGDRVLGLLEERDLLPEIVRPLARVAQELGLRVR